jgi:pimeloyl-ACP methyl ester carboxylesterase
MQKKENRFTPKKTNLEINYEEFYDKENTNIIVILHGWGGSSMSWLVV